MLIIGTVFTIAFWRLFSNNRNGILWGSSPQTVLVKTKNMNYTKAVLDHLSKAKPPYKWMLLMDTLTGIDTAWRNEDGSPIVYDTEFEALIEMLDDMYGEVEQMNTNKELANSAYARITFAMGEAFKFKDVDKLRAFLLKNEQFLNGEFVINEEELMKQVAHDESVVATIMDKLE